MTERDAFLAAILAAPDDDTPRLLFADWLDEHAAAPTTVACEGTGRPVCRECGDDTDLDGVCRNRRVIHQGNGFAERAEFIRVQCELAPIGPRRKLVYAVVEARRDGTGIEVAVDLGRTAKRHLPGPGDRIDVVGWAPRGGSLGDEKLHGLLVVERCDDHAVFLCKRDEASKTYPKERAKTLLRRERELLAGNAWTIRDMPVMHPWNRLCWGETPHPENDQPQAHYRRGFVHAITCSWPDCRDHLDTILKVQPVRRVELASAVELGIGQPVNRFGDPMLIDVAGIVVAVPHRPFPQYDPGRTPGWYLACLDARWPGVEFVLPTVDADKARGRMLG